MSADGIASERAIRRRLKNDLPHYAARCLKIRSKAGCLEPLILNGVQKYIHQCLENQRAKTGRVRALILKARQPGVSTYVGARFYWKVTHGRGLRAFILTHRDQATANLFAMAKRFHDQVPPLVKPLTKAGVLVNAMNRREVGPITFLFGKPGAPDKKYRKGGGLSHIIAKHGPEVLDDVVETIAKGIPVQRRGQGTGERIVLFHRGHEVVLSLYRGQDRDTWLLTGYRAGISDINFDLSQLAGPIFFKSN